jgi:hypothetical protein
MRSTDHARLLLRRAQYALAGLAVPVSMMVGMIAADPTTADIAPAVSQVVLESGSPWTSDRMVEQPAVSTLARAETAADSVAASAATDSAASDSSHRRDAALFVSLLTLSLCWAMLLVGGAIWRYRLAVRDYHDWADGWARVEPRWSNRTV